MIRVARYFFALCDKITGKIHRHKGDSQLRPEVVKSILTKYFPDGFRPRLNRDYILFRNYAGKESVHLPPDNESLRRIIESEGTYLDGSVFIISKELTDEIGSLILRIQDTKADVIFYSPLMNALQPTLSQNHIYSVEMFRDLLQANFPGLYYGKDSFTFSGAEQDEAISAEILRVWSSENALYPAEIAGRLPYIPLQEISVRLKTSPDFVRTAEEKYFLMKRFYVSDSEKEEIFRFVEESCRADGFAAIVNIPCESVRANNYELTGDGIYTAIFGKVLQGKFYRRHKIITDTKEGPDIVTVFKNYCRNRCECTVDELTELCRDLTGSEYPAGILSALYDTMIRISAKTFTEDYSVHFDTDETDRAISLFMAGQRYP